ncbi:MAG: transporter substrate-binding domain-containing protein [Sarcina sp.]
MKKGILKKVMGALLITTCMFSLVSCGGEKKDASVDNKPKNKLEEIKSKGVLVLGTSADYPPYEFKQNVNGKEEIVGFDIAIAKEIAAELGVKLELQDMDFDSLLAAMQAGSIDMIISGMNPTDKRKESADFSDIYYNAEHGIIVMEKDKDLYKNKDSFEGKTVGVQKSTVQEGLANDQMKGVTVKGLGKLPDLVMDMRVGNVQAIVCELPVAEFYASKNKDLYVIKDAGFEVDPNEKGSAIAMPKGQPELVTEVNKVLKKIKDEGKIDKFILEASELMNN